ncbi:hypothetical protein SO802_001067 [Lithocarpus litseifolius]|uniref:Uncharacterized protein n=1 Tax=Lithocarpus litseifolius TaxID=425828 RepID=A0AAW2DTM6_9ROSI
MNSLTLLILPPLVRLLFVSLANNEILEKNETKTEIASENNLDKDKSILGAPLKIEKKETRNPKSNKAKNKKSQLKKPHFCHHCGASRHTHPDCYKWLFCQISLTLRYPMSFGLGDRNLFVRNSGTRIIFTLDLIFEVLHVPRVVHPDYPDCDRLWTVSRDKLISHFCETPSIWGGKLNTLCSGFAKGPRLLNMVMTFNLTPLSHYNSITDPHAHFLLSLMEDLTIDFPSHFITFIIDVYQDTATHDKLIFSLAITRILQYFSIPMPLSLLFTIMGAISAGSARMASFAPSPSPERRMASPSVDNEDGADDGDDIGPFGDDEMMTS